MLISTICWNDVLNVENVDNAVVNIFNTNIVEIINCSSHSKHVNKNYKYRKLKKNWITKGLLVSIRHREKMHLIKNKRHIDRVLVAFYYKY